MRRKYTLQASQSLACPQKVGIETVAFGGSSHPRLRSPVILSPLVTLDDDDSVIHALFRSSWKEGFEQPSMGPRTCTAINKGRGRLRQMSKRKRRSEEVEKRVERLFPPLTSNLGSGIEADRAEWTFSSSVAIAATGAEEPGGRVWGKPPTRVLPPSRSRRRPLTGATCSGGRWQA